MKDGLAGSPPIQEIHRYALVITDISGQKQACKTPKQNMQSNNLKGETPEGDVYVSPPFGEKDTRLTYTRRQEKVADILANIVLRMLRATPSKSEHNETQKR